MGLLLLGSPLARESELALVCCIPWWFNSTTAHYMYLIPPVL